MFEIKLGERKSAGMNPGLQIAVQVFIRIHFRRIGGEIEDGYCFLMVQAIQLPSCRDEL